MKTIAMMFIAVFSAGLVMADNPHLVSGPTFSDNGNTLTVTGGIAGLGNNKLAIISVTALVEVSTICTNKGGNVAPGQSKTETIRFSGKFISDKNGRVNFTITSEVPKPGLCPNGNWKGEVTDVSFSNMVITINRDQVYP